MQQTPITPTFQYPQDELKRDSHRTPLPVPGELTAELLASVRLYGGQHVVTDGHGRQLSPRTIDRAMRTARAAAGLPDDFRFHDLRHYLASLLISRGLDVKVVQHRLRHASATTTLNIYAHLWPDADESARTAIGSVLVARVVGGDRAVGRSQQRNTAVAASTLSVRRSGPRSAARPGIGQGAPPGLPSPVVRSPRR